MLVVGIEEAEVDAVELTAECWQGKESPLIILHAVNASDRRNNALPSTAPTSAYRQTTSRELVRHLPPRSHWAIWRDVARRGVRLHARGRWLRDLSVQLPRHSNIVRSLATAVAADPAFDGSTLGAKMHGPSDVAAVVAEVVLVASDREVEGALWIVSVRGVRRFVPPSTSVVSRSACLAMDRPRFCIDRPGM